MVEQAKLIWNPYTPGYFENPYSHLKKCREQNPVQEIFENSWLLLKYKDVNEILSSKDVLASELHQFFKEKESYIFKNSNSCPYLHKGTKMWTMYLNDEAHKNSRMIMSKAINTKNYDKKIKESVLFVNNKYDRKQNFDLVNYCGEFVYHVVKEILGINSFEEYEKIKTYSNMLAKSQDLYIPKQVYLQINEWLLWGRDIFSDSELKDNITEYANESGLNYSDDDIYSIAAITLMAAFETSKDNLSMALYEILQNPKLIEYILTCTKDELNLLIEELFRFSSPLQYTIRVNKEPIEIHNKLIPAKSKLYLCLASANRDESVFKDPDTIIVDRTPNEHLSFGKGIHFCLGSSIARQELRYCLKPMAQFLKDYMLSSSDKIKWTKQIFMRTVESIPLELVNK